MSIRNSRKTGKSGRPREWQLPGRIEELMTARGVDLQTVAEKSGVPYNTLRELGLRGGGGSVVAWERLAQYFAVGVSFLRGESHPTTKPCQFKVVGTVGATRNRVGAFTDDGQAIEIPSDWPVLRVMDNSMEPLVREGQFVFYDPRATIQSGDLVVADLDDGLVIKQYHYTNGIHQFVSGNFTMGLPAIVRKSAPKVMYKVMGSLWARKGS